MQKLKRLPRPNSEESPVEQNLSDLAKSEKIIDKPNAETPAPKSPETKIIYKKRSFLHKSLNPAVFIFSMLSMLIIAGGYFIWVYFLSNPNSGQENKLLYNPVTQEPVSLTLNISSPDQNSLVFSEDLLVQGKTSSNAVVFLSLNDNDLVLETNSKGDFSQTIKLQKGANQIYISAADSAGNTKGETRTIYYSTEKI